MHPNQKVTVDLPQHAAEYTYKFLREKRKEFETFLNAQEHVEYGEETADIVEMELCDAAEIEWEPPY